jgi:hypothetical protein
MDRSELQKLIQQEIDNASVDALKELHRQKSLESSNRFFNSSDMNDDDIDKYIFFGGSAPKKEKKYQQVVIKESNSSDLKITTSEIKEFENSFKEMLSNIPGSTIVFDKQKNGHSLIAFKKPDGIEVKASGIINLGDKGKIIWSYSIANGLVVNSQNVKISLSNKTLFEELYNNYDAWQKTWREKLTFPGSDQAPADNTNMPMDMATSQADTTPPPVNNIFA